MPHEKARTTALGVRRIGEGFITVGGAIWAMRILWRSARAGGMLDARHELETTEHHRDTGELP